MCTLFQNTQGTVLTALPINEWMGMKVCHLFNLLKTCYSVHYQKKGVF